MSETPVKRQLSPSPTSTGSNDANKRIRNTRQNPQTCCECEEPIVGDQPTLCVICSKCDRQFHFSCLGITSKFIAKQIQAHRREWNCYSCEHDLIKHSSTSNLKIDKMEQTLKDFVTIFSELKASNESAEKSVAKLSMKIDNHEESTNQKINELQLQVNEIRTETDKMKEMEQKIYQLTTEIRDLQANKPTAQSNVTTDQTKEIMYLKSLQRRDNLIIKGVPSHEKEDKTQLVALIKRIGSACGTEICDNDIRHVYRLKRRQQKESINATSDAQLTSSSAPPTHTNKNESPSEAIVIRFTDNSSPKQRLFKNYISLIGKKKALSGSDVGLPTSKRIFIDQYLSSELLKIRDKAYELKRDKRIGKMNPRYNSIRIQIDNKWHTVTSMDQLNNIVGCTRSTNEETPMDQ